MANLVSFEDSVKERLKSIVAELIPEDRWQTIVHETIRQFETVDLPKLIKEELTVKYKAILVDEFKKPEWQSLWTNGQQQASEAVRQLIIDSAPLILASIIGGSTQSIIQQLQYTIQNRY